MSLAARAPASELAHLDTADANPWEVRLLVFGIIGTAIGAFQWSASPWFVQAKIAIAEWLVERDAYALLADDIPWWLLTHYPEANDVFTWLDGLLILAYITVTAAVIGGWISLWLRAAGRLLGEAGAHLRLAYALVPLGGVGVFLGLSGLTVTLLAAEGVSVESLPAARAALLTIATVSSLALAAAQLRRRDAPRARKLAAFLAFGTAVTAAVAPWGLMFYVW